MIYDLIPYTSEILNFPTQPFDFSNPPMNPKDLFENLKETQISHNGLGLSANQIGIPYSVFTFGNSKDPDSITGVFNPKIVNFSDEKDEMEEGCLSFKGLILKIERSKSIRLRFATWNGVVNTKTFSGMSAKSYSMNVII